MKTINNKYKSFITIMLIYQIIIQMKIKIQKSIGTQWHNNNNVILVYIQSSALSFIAFILI